MAHLEDHVEKQAPAVEQGAEQLAQEAVKDAFSKPGDSGSYKPQSGGSSSNDVLPGLQITNHEAEHSKNEDMNKMAGGQGSKELQDQLDQLRKDPHGNGGGSRAGSDTSNGRAGGSSQKGGKFEEGTSQSGRGESGGGKGLEMTDPAAKEKEPRPALKETETKASPKEVSPKPKSQEKAVNKIEKR